MQYTGRLDTIPSGISAGTTLLLRPGCSGCERVLDRLESLIEANPGADIGATILVDAELEQFARVRPLVAEHSRFGFDGLNERFGIRTLPAAVFLEPDGRFLRRVGSSAVLLLLPPDEHTGSGSEKINSGSPAG